MRCSGWQREALKDGDRRAETYGSYICQLIWQGKLKSDGGIKARVGRRAGTNFMLQAGDAEQANENAQVSGKGGG